MSSLNKGVSKVEVTLKWNPSRLGEPDHDLDLVAATFAAGDPTGKPVYLVHFGSRSPDGTITLNRDSRTGQGFGTDEEMTLELDRLNASFARVVVGVAIQQRDRRRTFADIATPEIRFAEGYTELLEYAFADVQDSTAATVAECVRAPSGAWEFRPSVRGFDADPAHFASVMGTR
ncbi:TerD family protein [Streptomyces liangshanensis]|uniref:TerD family protein n=1 Tax=Streptomyces liangshanensis TaxID=2717324 RepID=A0A6G9GVJ3_9ACTN|nr:TerD family protein [Streptomyces liangshanensis]QIQ02293.1 TerD family protein [Streptomyces liangshanensis]